MVTKTKERLARKMRKHSGIAERTLRFNILKLMSDGQVWSNARLKKHLPSLVKLNSSDKAPSAARPAEQMWMNRVNNALSGSRSQSLSARGYVNRLGHGAYRITDLGRSFFDEELESQKDIIMLVDEVLSVDGGR